MLKVGSFIEEVPANTQLHVEGQSDFMVVAVDAENVPQVLVARSSDRHCRFVTRQNMRLMFSITGKHFISVDARPVKSDSEEVSDIPYEVPDDNQAQLTLEEKLKVYLAEMVAERYGQESAMYDTFEEAMDFDDDDEDPISLSGFEIPDITEEELINVGTEDQGAAAEGEVSTGGEAGTPAEGTQGGAEAKENAGEAAEGTASSGT